MAKKVVFDRNKKRVHLLEETRQKKLVSIEKEKKCICQKKNDKRSCFRVQLFDRKRKKMHWPEEKRHKKNDKTKKKNTRADLPIEQKNISFPYNQNDKTKIADRGKNADLPIEKKHEVFFPITTNDKTKTTYTVYSIETIYFLFLLFHIYGKQKQKRQKYGLYFIRRGGESMFEMKLL
eukprot:GEMP01061798.1.p1 GENE.GEMP01061798.1~~GEMP01061798.1.p1  ORF type:complete len:178 (-),score=12.20 GEMP01061798.1:230-763(-)